MSPFRAALLALLVASASVATLSAAGAAGDAADATRDAATPPATLDAAAGNGTANDTSANNTSLGPDISSFMQSNAAEVGEAVETGMWTAAYNATENRTTQTRLVERRTADLRAELTDLRERKQELLAEREAGNVSDAAYTARIGQLVGRINALESALNATETRAREVNAGVENVTRLRTETADLAGPEIGTVARDLRGVAVSGNGPAGVASGDGTDADPGDGVDAGDGSSVDNGDSSDVEGSDDSGVGNGDSSDVGERDDSGVDNGDGNGVENGDSDDIDSGDGIGRNDDVTNAENESTTAANGLDAGLGGVAATGTQNGPRDRAPTNEPRDRVPTNEPAIERGVVGFVADALDAHW